MPDTDDSFPPIPADPYPWPFDGRWRAADTALLMLGFQRLAMATPGAVAAGATALRAAHLARGRGIAVFATRRGLGATDPPVLRRRATLGDQVPVAGSDGWALLDAMADLLSVPPLDHAGDNAFHGTGLIDLLRGRGIRNLLFAGLPTEGLVHATQRAANDAGFECLALADGCCGATPGAHTDQLRITAFGNGLFGAVAHLDALERALQPGKGAPN